MLERSTLATGRVILRGREARIRGPGAGLARILVRVPVGTASATATASAAATLARGAGYLFLIVASAGGLALGRVAVDRIEGRELGLGQRRLDGEFGIETAAHRRGILIRATAAAATATASAPATALSAALGIGGIA